MVEEKGGSLQTLEKQIAEKENELNGLKLEIKSKVDVLGTLNQLSSGKDENTLLAKLQSQAEELLVSDKQIDTLQKNIEALNASKIDPQLLKERDEKIAELEAQTETLTHENGSLKAQIDDINSNLTKLQQKFKSEEKKLLDEIQSLKDALNEANAANTHLHEELEEMYNIRDKYKDDKKELEEKLETALKQLAELEASQSQVQKEAEIVSLKDLGQRERELLQEVETQMQLVSDFHRANIRLQEELEAANENWKRAKAKTKYYKKESREAEILNKEYQAKYDKAGAGNKAREYTQQLGSSESNFALKMEIQKLREKLFSDNLKKKDYKKQMKELEHKYNHAVKALDEYKNKVEAEHHKKLKHTQEELSNLDEKYKKSKKKTKNYKAEQKKWKEMHEQLTKEIKKIQEAKEEKPANEDWKKIEQEYKAQIELHQARIKTNELHIDELKKHVQTLSQNQGSSAKSNEESERLNKLLKDISEINKDLEKSLVEKDAIIKELEENVAKLEEVNQEFEQHVEDVEAQVEQANTQVLEMQEQFHDKDQELSNLRANQEYLEQKLKQTSSKMKVLSDGMAEKEEEIKLKEEELRKKDEFGNRLIEELEKVKKKLSAANAKIQAGLKDQLAEFEKKIRERDIEIKILKDMVQSTKTMLRVRDNEIVRLRQKIHQLDIHSIALGMDPSERYLESQQSGQLPRGYNRSLDSKGMKNTLALEEKYGQRAALNEGEEDRLDKSIDSPGGESGEEKGMLSGSKKQGFLPAIDKSNAGQGQDPSQRSSVNLNNFSDVRSSKGKELRHILAQPSDDTSKSKQNIRTYKKTP